MIKMSLEVHTQFVTKSCVLVISCVAVYQYYRV